MAQVPFIVLVLAVVALGGCASDTPEVSITVRVKAGEVCRMNDSVDCAPAPGAQVTVNCWDSRDCPLTAPVTATTGADGQVVLMLPRGPAYSASAAYEPSDGRYDCTGRVLYPPAVLEPTSWVTILCRVPSWRQAS